MSGLETPKTSQQGKVAATEIDATTAIQPTNSECGTANKHSGLESSVVPGLRKLAEYETVCNGEAASSVSFFTALPTTPAEAVAQGKDVAGTLKEYGRFGIQPLVFLEPNTPAGNRANFTTYKAGGYDTVLDTYFATIKASGITDTQMGTWTPLPEWNIPVWGNTDPQVFGNLFTRTVQLQKKHFPASKASILLESKSYPSGTSWENGTYASLLPYVKDIPKGLADSFGMQGFPWGAMDSGDAAILDPTVYLRPDLAIPAARAVGATQVWFNTGTFRYFAQDTNKPTSLTPEQRQQMLAGSLGAAKTVQAAGLTSALHLFAQDKSATDEKIDWSYWSAAQMNSSPAMPVFKTLVHDAKAANVPLWLYDSGE